VQHVGASSGCSGDAEGGAEYFGDAAAAASPGAGGDALSLTAAGDELCGWCRRRPRAATGLWCSKRCRQTAWRFRKLVVAEDLGDTPKRLAYADPPYPGTARRWYGDQPNYAGEVDHRALVSLLQDFDGWALSTSQAALREVLPLCPEGVRIAAWIKPNGAAPATRGPHGLWEPIIYQTARRRRPGVRDWISAKPARGGGTLPGRKPLAICAFVFRLLGASPVDQFSDLYPGTGIVGAAWREFVSLSRAPGVAVTEGR